VCVCVFQAGGEDNEGVAGAVVVAAVAGSVSLLHSVTSTIYHATDLGTPRPL